MSVGVEDRSLRLLNGLIVGLQIGGIPRALEAINLEFKVSLTPFTMLAFQFPRYCIIIGLAHLR